MTFCYVDVSDWYTERLDCNGSHRFLLRTFVSFVSGSGFSLLVLENTYSTTGRLFGFPESAHIILASVSRGFLEI